VTLSKFSKSVRAKFQKQADYLMDSIRHPSLHAKRYEGTRDVWQVRVDKSIRFYFIIKKDVYVLLDIRTHG
jgi:hypothetical protein